MMSDEVKVVDITPPQEFYVFLEKYLCSVAMLGRINR